MKTLLILLCDIVYELTKVYIPVEIGAKAINVNTKAD